MLIAVTQEHIDKGFRAACTACPIALAMGRGLHEGYVVRVGLSTYSIKTLSGKEVHRACLPDTAKQFRHDFDEGNDVEPFNFVSGIPHNIMRDRVL